MKRTSFSLPPDLVSDLSYVSRRLGVSRSGLVSELLGSVVGSYAQILNDLPEGPDGLSEVDVKRFRGASAALVRERVQSAKDLHNGNDLFS